MVLVPEAIPRNTMVDIVVASMRTEVERKVDEEEGVAGGKRCILTATFRG